MTYSPPPPPLPSKFITDDDETVICTNCGAPADPDYIKCRYCGKDRK